jgi:pimeloyl-ACP methyl ester carboxylesterase
VTTWFDTPPTQFQTIDGLSIRFAESEERDDHALLVGPWPESLLAFEPTWARLAEHTHLVAVDLPGFGHSQDGADEYAALVTNWCAGGYARAVSVPAP